MHVIGNEHLSSYAPLDSRLMADIEGAFPGAIPVKIKDANELIGCLSLTPPERASIDLLLCPPGHLHQGVLELRRLLRYPDLLTMARSHAAVKAAP